MGFFNRKIAQLEQAEEQANSENINKIASDKAVDIIKELSGAKQESKKKMLDNLIVFTSASGGTGVSTLASNIAYTAATKYRLKTLMIDLNIECPVQHINLGVKQAIEKKDLVSFLMGKNDLSESIDTTHAINLLYANNRTINDEVNISARLPIGNFNLMLDKVKALYDIVIVDCPMRIDSMLHNVMLYRCDAIYVVWDESMGSTINTDKIRRNMALSGIDSFTKMRIILNKRTSVHFTDFSTKKMNMEMIGILPFDSDIIDNGLRGKIFCENGSTNSKNAALFANRIEEITEKVIQIAGRVQI
jgi:MinD-like ATPase involved in chromosome partitioning or flagellar assembly